jgi:septum formation inhibitor-activating ATPase MinD
MRYLILTYYRQASGKTDEVMTVAQKLKSKDLDMAGVILDFKELKVIKASVGGVNAPRDFNKIVGYYMQYYQNIIERLFADNGFQIETNQESNMNNNKTMEDNEKPDNPS